MSNGISNTLDTTSRVYTYLINLIKLLDDKNIKLSKKDIVDIAGYLDNISKKANEYVKQYKKEIPLSNTTKSMSGNVYIATFSESIKTEINPVEFFKEVDKETFIDCIKVNTKKAKEAIPEDRVKKLQTITGTTVKISFKEL